MMQFVVTQDDIHIEDRYQVIPEIQAVWNCDPHPDKIKAKRMLQVVYYLADEESPTADLFGEDKIKYAFRNARLSPDKLTEEDHQLLREAVACYEAHNFDGIRSTIATMDRTILATQQMLATTEPVIQSLARKRKVGKDEDGNWEYEEYTEFISNADCISEYCTKLDEMIDVRDKLFQKYVRKKAEGKNRADVKPGLLDRGLLINPVIAGKRDQALE